MVAETAAPAMAKLKSAGMTAAAVANVRVRVLPSVARIALLIEVGGGAGGVTVVATVLVGEAPPPLAPMTSTS